MFDTAAIAEAGLRRALTKAGSQVALAQICECTQGAIWQMLNKPRPALSVQYVLKVEAALGIPRHLLRPDIYPDIFPSPVPSHDSAALAVG